MKKVIILLAALVIIFFLYQILSSYGYLEKFNPENIYNTRSILLEYVNANFIISALIFVVTYFAAVAASIPGAALLTLTGGFLFGPVTGTILVNIGASTGALIIFLAARYFLGSQLQVKYGDKLNLFNKEFEENGSSYLLMLRLVPVFPFFSYKSAIRIYYC